GPLNGPSLTRPLSEAPTRLRKLTPVQDQRGCSRSEFKVSYSIFGPRKPSRLETWVRVDAWSGRPNRFGTLPQLPGRQARGGVVWAERTCARRRPCPTSVIGPHLPLREMRAETAARARLPCPADPSG